MKYYKKRKQVKQRILETLDPTELTIPREQYRSLNKYVKRWVRRDKINYFDSLSKMAQNAADRHNLKDLLHISRKLMSNSFRKHVPVKDIEGKTLTSVEEQLGRWQEHFMEILHLRREGIIHEYNIDVPALNINVKPPSKPKINLAIRQMKNGNAGGSDGIVSEILKVDITLSTEILFPLFQDVCKQEKFPLDWKEGIIVKVPKKGDLGNCNNWRGINLLNVISKVFYRVILNRIATIIDLKLRPEQAGFRPNRSCVDQINSLRIIIEQAVE
jgi:hypothetical protein